MPLSGQFGLHHPSFWYKFLLLLALQLLCGHHLAVPLVHAYTSPVCGKLMSYEHLSKCSLAFLSVQQMQSKSPFLNVIISPLGVLAVLISSGIPLRFSLSVPHAAI